MKINHGIHKNDTISKTSQNHSSSQQQHTKNEH